jgi:Fe-S cluster assembly protein SufB
LKQDPLLLGNIQVVYLVGDNSQGEFYSVALTNNYQQADTGTKMIHIGKNSRSRIISKGISAGKSKNSYRGLVMRTNKALVQEIIHNVILY